MIKDFIKELNVKFKEKSPYSDEFVSSMEQAIKDFDNGVFVKMSKDELRSS